MNIQDFKLFLDVADLGSLTKAAAQRRTVQSHISRQIADLEASCGASLFRRTGRGVVLTEFGRDVEVKARAWVRDSEALFADVRQSSKLPMGEVRLAILPSAAHPLLTHVFKRLHQEYPKIRLNVREGQGGELDALLDSNIVDMAILFRYEKPTSADEKLLSTASTFLVSRPGLPLTARATVDFKQLRDLPMVLPRPSSHWRSILDQTARSKGFQWSPLIEADSLRLQKEIICENPQMYALLGPFSVDEELRSGRLQVARVVKPDLKRYVTLAQSKHGQFTQAGRVVAGLIEETVAGWKGRMAAPIR